MAVIRKLDKESEEKVIHLAPPKKKKFNSDHDESNWLISYADMMTLLCVFYIMMFSMAKINTQEFEKVKKQVAEHFGSKYESPTEDLGKFVTQIVQEAGVSKDVVIESDGVSVSLAFHSTLFFESMSAEVSPSGQLILDRIIAGMKEQEEKSGRHYKFVVEGHTDAKSVIGGPYPTNWELSSSRATRVVRYFIAAGFKPENLLAMGFSDTQAIVPSRNDDGTWNEENLAKNRRVVLRVLLPDVDSIPFRVKSSTQGTPTQ